MTAERREEIEAISPTEFREHAVFAARLANQLIPRSKYRRKRRLKGSRLKG